MLPPPKYICNPQPIQQALNKGNELNATHSLTHKNKS